MGLCVLLSIERMQNEISHLTTEASSNYDSLELMSTLEILESMNQEDQTVPKAIEKVLPDIEQVVERIVERVKAGGKLYYIGAGTSGRLGVVDASECLPTFGVGDIIFGLIAGGDTALRNPVEHAEDSNTQAWEDLVKMGITESDCVIGITASGRTPYVVHGIEIARSKGLFTAGITCNENSKLSVAAEKMICVVVGPEFLTGSTRLKAGTAQKLVLNMISTSLMIRLGKVKGNKMVDMRISNTKLVQRAVRMISEELQISEDEAKPLLEKFGSVRKAVDGYWNPQ